MADEAASSRPARLTRRRLALLVGTGAVAAVVAGVWSIRDPVARNLVDSYLAGQGVEASYDRIRTGLRTQRIENLVIGDPRSPDLVARWVEVDVGFGTLRPSVTAIRANGLRLKGAIDDKGNLTLGALDQLLPKGSAGSFTLPDVDVTLDRAVMRLDTPMGAVGLAASGRGNLRHRFTGDLAVVAHRLDLDGCSLVAPRLNLNLAVTNSRPAIDGPLSSDGLSCDGVSVSDLDGAVDVAFNQEFNRWNGGAVLDGKRLALKDGPRVANVRARLGFDGGTEATESRMRLSLSGIEDAQPANWAAGLAGTPVGPLAAELSQAARQALAAMEVTAAARLAGSGPSIRIVLSQFDARSESGARLHLADGLGLSWGQQQGLGVHGEYRLQGGGFPGVVARLDHDGRATEGVIEMEPYAARGARIAVTPIQFRRGRVRTQISLDGPLADGRIEGLRVLLDGRQSARGITLNDSCTPLRFTRLEIAGTTVGPTELPLCPLDGAIVRIDSQGRMGGGATIAAPRVRARLGESPLTLVARRLDIPLDNPGFVLEGLQVRLGEGSDPTRLDIASLTGGLSAGAISGSFSGTTGKIGNVPLLVSDGAGTWSLADSVLALEGGVAIEDAAADPRFYRLESEDTRLRLAGGKISGTGTLTNPKTGRSVTRVTLGHDLGTGRGEAVLGVDALAFDDTLQPEMLTPLTLGVIADVKGALSGEGRIRWNEAGVTSDGKFSTETVDFAAAFGPVKGLSGTVNFSDLLGMVTLPGQMVQIAEVNPGVAVNEGTIRYQLLPGQVVRLEDGRWPFAGGTLSLDQTELDFGQPVERHMTFRVTGLDIAQFIEQFQFKNVAVTGIFDGTLPMIFDHRGGRIEQGRLVVREGGGKLAYVGEVSNEKLGRYGNMAFDALRSIRYQNLGIQLDGSLDGEFVSRIVFNGFNEVPLEGNVGMMRDLVGLPFRFNITITAPFRALVNSAQSINDPRALVSDSLLREGLRQSQPDAVQGPARDRVQ